MPPFLECSYWPITFMGEGNKKESWNQESLWWRWVVESNYGILTLSKHLIVRRHDSNSVTLLTPTSTKLATFGFHVFFYFRWTSTLLQSLTYTTSFKLQFPLQWRHNEHDGVPNHRPLDCLPNRLFMDRSKKTSKLHVTGLCEGNPPVTGGFPS